MLDVRSTDGWGEGSIECMSVAAATVYRNLEYLHVLYDSISIAVIQFIAM